jgi:DNA polymerase I-like protein with 3'-5' exonuclease and polymerase domains
MRLDSIGMFWEDLPAKKGEKRINRIMPDIPFTGWVAPREFPNLSSAPYLSIDTETRELDFEAGPGWARGKGHIIGVSVSVPGQAWYFPMRHEVMPEQNLNPEHVLAWCRDMFGNPAQPKIGANLIYDVGWLGEEGVPVKGMLYDVQFAEALLDETARVNLDALGVKYLQTGKETSILYQWSSDYYGGPCSAKQRANLYRCPPCLVGPYAEADAVLPAQILPHQWLALEREGLLPLYEMECKLIPLLVAMRRAGVSVDIKRAEEIRDRLVLEEKALEKRMGELCGFEVNPGSNPELQKAFRKLGIPIPLSTEGKPSFAKALLLDTEHPLAELILARRRVEKCRSTFIESAILEKHVNGRIYCQFHPLRGDDEGTRSGRFSSADPNLQQVPSRDEELAPLVRGCFIPDPGHKQWRRYDYSQIEYRKLAHYAVGQGSDDLRRQYNADPKTDYHINAQRLVTGFTGIEIPRKPIKNFNFGMTFGMGKAKMVRSTQMELRKMGSKLTIDGDQLYEAYHGALPFAKATIEHFGRMAQDLGFVSTILGRRSRFELWEPDDRGRGEERKQALPYHMAQARYGRIKRAYTHKALNRVLQGSAADFIKKAMLLCWESGVFDTTGVPRLTVHDELDFSDPGEGSHIDAAWDYVKRTLENALPLRVPVIAELEVGASWGSVE